MAKKNLNEPMKLVKIPNDSVSSDWKCPECGNKSKGHTFQWHQDNGTPQCECGTDMKLRSVHMSIPVAPVQASTVNVIEFGEEPTDIKSLRAFTDDEAGNEAAETLFKACVIENGGSGDDIEEDIEDGYWIAPGGTYTIVITHST